VGRVAAARVDPAAIPPEPGARSRPRAGALPRPRRARAGHPSVRRDRVPRDAATGAAGTNRRNHVAVGRRDREPRRRPAQSRAGGQGAAAAPAAARRRDRYGPGLRVPGDVDRRRHHLQRRQGDRTNRHQQLGDEDRGPALDGDGARVRGGRGHPAGRAGRGPRRRATSARALSSPYQPGQRGHDDHLPADRRRAARRPSSRRWGPRRSDEDLGARRRSRAAGAAPGEISRWRDARRTWWTAAGGERDPVVGESE